MRHNDDLAHSSTSSACFKVLETTKCPFLRKPRLFLVMLFLQGIAVNMPVPVSQLLAPERHEFDLVGHRVLKYESKSIFGNAR